MSLSKEVKSVIGGGGAPARVLGGPAEGGGTHGGTGVPRAASGGGGGRVGEDVVTGTLGRGVAVGGPAGEPCGGRGAARLRSCSDGSRYRRRGAGSSSFSSISPPLSNPKSGETSS